MNRPDIDELPLGWQQAIAKYLRGYEINGRSFPRDAVLFRRFNLRRSAKIPKRSWTHTKARLRLVGWWLPDGVTDGATSGGGCPEPAASTAAPVADTTPTRPVTARLTPPSGVEKRKGGDSCLLLPPENSPPVDPSTPWAQLTPDEVLWIIHHRGVILRADQPSDLRKSLVKIVSFTGDSWLPVLAWMHFEREGDGALIEFRSALKAIREQRWTEPADRERPRRDEVYWPAWQRFQRFSPADRGFIIAHRTGDGRAHWSRAIYGWQGMETLVNPPERVTEAQRQATRDMIAALPLPGGLKL